MRLTCPTCKRPMEAPDGAAGRKVVCPHCGQKILLPTVPAPKPAATNPTVLAAPETLEPTTAVAEVAAVLPPPTAAPAPTVPAVVPVSVVASAPPQVQGRPSVRLAPILLGGGALLAVVLVVALVVVFTRTPSYTPAELVSAYHHGMKGQRVRVTGPIFDVGTMQQGGGVFVRLYTPGQRLQVVALNVTEPNATKPLVRDDVITLAGQVDVRVSFRPGQLMHDGTRTFEEVDMILLINAHIER